MKLPSDILLGQSQAYPDTYSPDLLYPVPRSLGREALSADLSFTGFDRWTGFELSWLAPSGKPQAAIFEVDFAVDSENIIESKSFKLYLNAFNQTLMSKADIQETLLEDLSRVSGKPVQVRLFDPEAYPLQEPEGYTLLDALDVSCTDYEVNPALLQVTPSANVVTEKLKSHLFRSLCPVTSQPDWASVYIEYTGSSMDHASILAYLVSFRKHQGFHEQCVEMIFQDILTRCQPEALTVFARFMRRGGLDINPMRTNIKKRIQDHIRTARQ